jgi:hypothetical protein
MNQYLQYGITQKERRNLPNYNSMGLVITIKLPVAMVMLESNVRIQVEVG